MDKKQATIIPRCYIHFLRGFFWIVWDEDYREIPMKADVIPKLIEK